MFAVERFRAVVTRNLLILGTAKTAALPDSLYVYCTKILFALDVFDEFHLRKATLCGR
jgi:hypothetical protein